MFRYRFRYNEITRKRGYDFLVMIVMTLAVRSLHPSVFSWIATIAFFLSMVGLYQLVNELIHRHVQALVSAIVLSSLGVAELALNEWILMACSMNVISIWLAVSVFRKYGAGWRKLVLAALLTGFSVWVGGIWPMVYFTLPAIVVLLIAVRPILYYKRWSFSVALIIVAGATVSGILFRGENLHEMIAESNEVEWFSVAKSQLYYYKAWLLIFAVTWCYALRKGMVHGDIAANAGGWMFLLMMAVGVLFPVSLRLLTYASFVPVSLCICGYMNFITLPRICQRSDRVVYRLLMVIPASVTLLWQVIRDWGIWTVHKWLVYLVEILLILALLNLCYRHRRRKKLPVISIVVIYAIFSLLISL